MVLEKSKLLEMLIGPSLLLISILEDRGITLSSCDLQGICVGGLSCENERFGCLELATSASQSKVISIGLSVGRVVCNEEQSDVDFCVIFGMETFWDSKNVE